jgi:hypothetical protein
MKYLLVVTTAIFIGLGTIAWNFTGVIGNGDVIKKKRTITENFHSIEVSQGIDLYVKQGNEISVTVEADENVYDILMTEVKKDVLHIYFDKNVRKVNTKKVWVTVKDLQALRASSGADIFGESKLKGENIKLSSSSGADIKVELDYNSVKASGSSGSDIHLSGTCNELYASSSSGSDIEAEELTSKNVTAESSSGSDIIVHATGSLDASASSGSDIICKGNPSNKNISKSSGGSVKIK